MALRDFYNQSIITDPYGTPRDGGSHTGVDFGVNEGTSIPAFLPGEVVAINRDDRYGNYVDVKSKDGVVTRYAHMQVLPNYGVGHNLLIGDTVGLSGATGFVTGPHLHVEVLKDGSYVDPWPSISELANLSPDWIEKINADFLGGGGSLLDAITDLPGNIIGGAKDAVGLGGEIFGVFGDIAKYSAELVKWILTERHWWAIIFGAGGVAMIGVGLSVYFNKEITVTGMSAGKMAATKGMVK